MTQTGQMHGQNRLRTDAAPGANDSASTAVPPAPRTSLRGRQCRRNGEGEKGLSPPPPYPRPPVVWQDPGPLALAADLTAERLSGYASAKSRVVRDGTKASDVRGSVMATQTETSSAEVKLTRLQLLGLIEGLETA